MLDAFIVQQQAPWPGTKFQAIGEAWRECSWPEAKSLIESLTSTSMAYLVAFQMEWTGAVSPSAFLSKFAGNARLYTNVGVPEGSWMPATTATFDRGVAAIDDESIGIFWAQDED
jgi:hypothetical protein